MIICPRRRIAGTGAAGAALLVLVLLLAGSGCSGPSAGPAANPSPGGPSVTDSPSPTPSGAAELTVVVDDGSDTTTWTLTCDPPGGTHPDAETACAMLAAHGERALPPKGKDVVCTQVYGGPERATVTGTWRGQPVRSTFTRTDGCEIDRWDLLVGLLPRV